MNLVFLENNVLFGGNKDKVICFLYVENIFNV